MAVAERGLGCAFGGIAGGGGRLRRDRSSELVEPVSLTASELSRDRWALAIARIAAALVAIGAFTGAAVANIAAVVMVMAFITAPSSVQRVKWAWYQPLGKACLVFLGILLLSIAWSEAPLFVALKAWVGWRHFLLLFIALAIFDTRFSKLAFATTFVVAATAAAAASFFEFDFGAAQATSDVAQRNHSAQSRNARLGADNRRIARACIARARTTRFVAAMGMGFCCNLDGRQCRVCCVCP